jgi:hypothetical protein
MSSKHDFNLQVRWIETKAWPDGRRCAHGGKLQNKLAATKQNQAMEAFRTANE